MSNHLMLASEPTTSNTSTIQALEQELPFIKFPPFPEPPPGVTIMSFKDFKPRGIQLFSESRKSADDGEDEDVELDALGIPTVELRIKHVTDECKGNTRKKRKKKKAAAEAGAAPVKKTAWYEEWEEGEDLRVTKVRYDANISPADRFYQSSFDFRTGRPWPPVSSGLNNIWDQFRLFTGLLVNPSVYRKANTKNLPRAESPDFDSDDEDDPVMNIGDGGGDSRPAKRQRSGEAPDFDNDSDPQKVDEEIREEKISIFLGNPEKAVRIFLSSYMREHGLIWTERNLVHTPRLIWFFLAFVLRNGVLLEPVYRRGLKQALETIDLAKKELPLTHTVGHAIPDAFNEACRECFGRQGGMNWSVVNGTTTEQKDATITVTDISNGLKTDVALPTETLMHVKDAIEDNVDMEVSIDTAATIAKENPPDEGWGWDNSWAGDDNTWAQGGLWGDGTQGDQGADGEAGAGAQLTDPDPSWKYDLKSLLPLLGPSVFPLTHTAGIVECSTRRVSAIHFPPGHPKGVSSSSRGSLRKAAAKGRGSQDWTASAEGVEADLDARFAKVILEPWGRAEGDIVAPEIWNTSRGPVVDPTNPSKILGDPFGTATRKPHNPLKDNITLLVLPSVAETLEIVKGLGLGAMWIEIVRQKPGVGVNADGGPAPVDTATPGRFWYHEDVTGIFPSFYTPGEKEQGGD